MLYQLWGQGCRVGQADSIMNGTISSPNCHLQLQVNATTDHRETSFSKAINYTLMITGISFAQVFMSVYPCCTNSFQSMVTALFFNGCRLCERSVCTHFTQQGADPSGGFATCADTLMAPVCLTV